MKPLGISELSVYELTAEMLGACLRFRSTVLRCFRPIISDPNKRTAARGAAPSI
jgi:hypothetical protein